VTAIVGISDGRGSWIGADSLASDGWSQHGRSDSKLFRRGPFLIGFTDSFRLGQLLRYRLNVAPSTGADLAEFMATEFVDAVRTVLKDGGYATRKEEQEAGGHFIVSVKGRLFVVWSDYQVAEPAEGYAAVGSGQLAAMGSFHTSGLLGLEPHRRCLLALAAAAHPTAGVRGPFRLKRDSALAIAV